MRNKRQYGSAVTVVIVIAVIAIIGVVGYVLLSKLKLVPSLDSFGMTNQSQNASNTDNLNTASFDKSFGVAMSFSYPKTWSIDKKHEGKFPVTTSDTSIETYTLKAPGDTYSVVYRLGAGGGLGGTCDPASAGTIVAADSEEVKGWKGVKFVRAITKSSTGKYFTKVGLMPTLTMYKLKVGHSACEFGLGVTTVPSMTFALTLLDASIHNGKDMNILYGTPNDGVTTEKDARALFSGKMFEEAKAILLSTTLK